MKRRQHGGWVGWYFKQIITEGRSHTKASDATLNIFNTVRGLKRRMVNLLSMLNITHVNAPRSTKLINNVLFKEFDNFMLDPILYERYDSTYLKNMAYVRLVLSRSRRARLLATHHASYGQSSWHGAKSPRYLNLFLDVFSNAFEHDLFKRAYRKLLRFRRLHRGLTKSDEMRMKIRINRRGRNKAGKKFKKFGERQLATLKKRKSLWK